MVLPLLLALVLGLAELGLFFRSYLTASTAATDGMRMVSISGDAANADCVAIGAVGAALSTTNLVGSLQRVEIFRSTDGGQQIMSDTNTYRYQGGDPSDCASWSAAVTWPSTSRNTIVDNNPGALRRTDLAGVRVVMHHGWFSGLYPFRGTVTIDEARNGRLEPEAFST